MKIKVTDEYIDYGVKDDPELCPVALAISDAVAGSEVYVNDDDIAIEINGKHFEFVIPAVREFVDKFDNESGTAKPFEFDLPLEERL